MRAIVFCFGLLILLGTASLSALADGHNVLNDASFEQRTSSKEGGWQLFEVSLVSDDEARSGEQAMFNGGHSRTAPHPPYFIGIVSGSFQEFPADPGSRWRLTGYGLTKTKLKGTPAFGVLQVSFFDAEGKDLGTVETAGEKTPAKTSNEVNRKTPIGEWTFLDTGIVTAPEGAAAIQAFTLYVDYSGSDSVQGVFFDDLVLCTVDEDNPDSCSSE